MTPARPTFSPLSPAGLAPIGLGLAASLALVLAVAGCSGAPPQQAGPTQVGVITLAAQPLTLSNELTGRTSAVAIADVRPQVDGVIRDRLFAEGSLVRAGQPLYQIDARLYKASLDTAAAQLESAQATLADADAKAKRYRALPDPQAVSAQDMDDTLATARTARASVHQYSATVETARVNLEYTRVLAPITGRIGRSTYTKGALVSASQTTALATITQLDPIYVDITQSAAEWLRLRQALAKGSILPTSTSATLKLEDGTTYGRPGSIEFTEVAVDESAGTVTLRARFPNPDGLLLPGMFVRVATPQGNLPRAILAPQQGITRDAKGNATALVVNRAGKVEQRNVVADRAIGTSWLVTSGLAAGDQLIVEGTSKVHAGDPVHATQVKLGQ